MKIKRFVAHDMRQAMQMVRETQGPDAVILSTRRIETGIEVVSALDYDEALVREAMTHLHEPAPASSPGFINTNGSTLSAAVANNNGSVPAATELPAPSKLREAIIKFWPKPAPVIEPIPKVNNEANFISEQFRDLPEAPPAAMTENAPDMPDVAEDHATIASTLTDPAGLADQPALSGVHSELNQLRQILESQMSSLAWNDLGRRQPGRARVLRELARYDIEPDVAAEIAEGVANEQIADQSSYLTLGLLARRLTGNISGNDFLDHGGVIALVGPTGVGKTTTIAKLAARFVLRNGRGKMALISTDDFRIGAKDQLLRYGRLLGIPVYSAADSNELTALLSQLSEQHTVLIDTPGMGFRDAQLNRVIATLNNCAPNIRHTLVLAANAQVGALDEATRAFSELKPAGCILTKLDETPSLGGALSVVMRRKLMLDFVAYGQRVPEDIVLADTRRLVCRLTSGHGSQVPDEMQMAERFGHTALAYA